MKKFKLTSLIIVFCLLQTSCATMTIIGSTYPAKHPSVGVDVYISKLPACEYDEVALIKADNFSSDNNAMTAVKTKAREVGADAIIIVGSASVSSYNVPVGNFTYSATQKSGIKAIAIKYKE